jgi:hypothetical protein
MLSRYKKFFRELNEISRDDGVCQLPPRSSDLPEKGSEGHESMGFLGYQVKDKFYDLNWEFGTRAELAGIHESLGKLWKDVHDTGVVEEEVGNILINLIMLCNVKQIDLMEAGWQAYGCMEVSDRSKGRDHG